MEHDSSRRDFVKKAAYTAPALMTLSALPSLASAGSNRGSYRSKHRGRDRWHEGGPHRRHHD